MANCFRISQLILRIAEVRGLQADSREAGATIDDPTGRCLDGATQKLNYHCYCNRLRRCTMMCCPCVTKDAWTAIVCVSQWIFALVAFSAAAWLINNNPTGLTSA